MRLEKIELIGFKSFAEKTAFSFHPGITAIVGPNGCGKSNIVDAFKWVLGEQSAKSLRGSSMEDVIFFGSATKKTKGMAEVTLILSGTNGRPPGSENSSQPDTDGTVMSQGDTKDNENNPPESPHTPLWKRVAGGNFKGWQGGFSDKISVTRRLYRSGESEYLMNKVPCRLKDIKNVLLDTGLEVKAYSILEQGRINDILQSKPLDRRFLIEEVAGVMKYKVRKAEALQKLEASKSNLQRLQDIINEVRRQINSIDRHAKRAERYKKLFEEIKNIDIRIAKRDVKALQDDLLDITSSENRLKANESELISNLHSAEALIEEKKRVCVDREKALDETRTRLYSLGKEITEGEGKAALLKRDCENLGERHKSLLIQDDEFTAEKEAITTQLKKIEDENSGMESRLFNLESALEDKNKKFSDIEGGIGELEYNLDAERRLLFNKAEEISNIRNEIKHLSLLIENISHQTEKKSEDINSVRDGLSSLGSATARIKDEYIKAESELASGNRIKEERFNELNRKKIRLAASEESLYMAREELAVMSSKLESLKELYASQKSAVNEIKTLCQVADIFETSPEYETAIEAVLGDKLNAAVVEDRHEIARALQLIKEHNTRRSGFISVEHAGRTPGSSGNAEMPDFQISDDVIGRAVALITVKNGFDKVAAALLDDVVVVDNLNTAFSLWERSITGTNSKPIYFATLEGEVLEPSGFVFGGIDKGVLKIKRKLKELEKDIATRKERSIEDENSVSTLRSDIAAIENDIVSINNEITGKEKYCHELKVKITGMEEENARQLKKLEYLSIEIDNDHKERENLKRRLEEKRASSETLEEGRQLTEENIRSIQDRIAESKESLEMLRSELTEIKLDLTAIREKMTSISREKERLNTTILETDKKKTSMLNERIEIEGKISRMEEEIREKESGLKSNIVLIGEMQTGVSKINEILEAKTAELQLVETRQKSFISELEMIRRELGHVEVKKTESSMKLNYIKEDIRKTYSVEIEAADAADAVTEEEEEGLPRLKDKLQEIGPVSLGTLEEFEELKGRYEFLTTQQDDLLQSITSLQETILKINRSTQKRLTDAFEALTKKFKEVFTTLFGGGKAELILTESNILEAGLDVVAQPPGKKLKNLMSLSGGEQALTALSLLFAGFMVKPTPMCILDEVDAPLDESNTERFIRMLAELSLNIQFITITHNRITMEAADYIYGITMEEPGASKVISMHLAEAV